MNSIACDEVDNFNLYHWKSWRFTGAKAVLPKKFYVLVWLLQAALCSGFHTTVTGVSNKWEVKEGINK